MQERTVSQRWILAGLMGLAAAGVTHGGGEFIQLPTPWQGSVRAICPSGDVAVGYVNGGAAQRAAVWEGLQGGMITLTQLPDGNGNDTGPSIAHDCGYDADGNLIVVGRALVDGEPAAVVWVNGIVTESVPSPVDGPWLEPSWRSCSNDGCVRAGSYLNSSWLIKPIGQVCGDPMFEFPTDTNEEAQAATVSPDGRYVAMWYEFAAPRLFDLQTNSYDITYEVPENILGADIRRVLADRRAAGEVYGTNGVAFAGRWSPAGCLEALPDLVNGPSTATDMAEDGTVVGKSASIAGLWQGVVWEADGAVVPVLEFLEARGVPVPDYDPYCVETISGDGRIIAGAGLTSGGQLGPWVAIVGSLGDVNEDGVVDISDLLIILGFWGECLSTCPADIDGDGSVGIDDLLIVLGEFEI